MADVIATFKKVLQAPEPYKDEEEKAQCKELVEMLAPEMVEMAAHSSYAYWYLATQQTDDAKPTDEQKLDVAMREARRHLITAYNNMEKAYGTLSESCEYRKEHKLNLLRTCFQKRPDDDTSEDAKKAKEMATLIEQDLRRQLVVMRGKDKASRSIMIKFPRIATGTTEESYLMAQLYMAERSIASTEYLSEGKQDRSLAVYDYTNFDSKNAPPFAIQVSAATLLQKLYPERLHMLVMLEPPLWLRGVLTLLGPFLSTSIQDRMKLATGMEQRTGLFKTVLDEDQATPLLLPGGKLTAPISLGHFLEDVPFYGLYDDVKCEREIEEIVPPPVPVPAEQPSLTQSILGSLW